VIVVEMRKQQMRAALTLAKRAFHQFLAERTQT
jgi:hypothetical protein